MRICMFNNLFPPVKSGSSHFTVTLSRNLVARGHQVTVVTARLPGTADVEDLDGITVHRLPCFMLPAMEIAHGDVEDVFTRSRTEMLGLIRIAMGGQSAEPSSIVGPLCTPLDLLADRMALPAADVGDLAVVFQSGAYGASASPSAFLGHPAVTEILI